jgi:hypothetical protein
MLLTLCYFFLTPSELIYRAPPKELWRYQVALETHFETLEESSNNGARRTRSEGVCPEFSFAAQKKRLTLKTGYRFKTTFNGILRNELEDQEDTYSVTQESLVFNLNYRLLSRNWRSFNFMIEPFVDLKYLKIINNDEATPNLDDDQRHYQRQVNLGSILTFRSPPSQNWVWRLDLETFFGHIHHHLNTERFPALSYLDSRIYDSDHLGFSLTLKMDIPTNGRLDVQALLSYDSRENRPPSQPLEIEGGVDGLPDTIDSFKFYPPEEKRSRTTVGLIIHF